MFKKAEIIPIVFLAGCSTKTIQQSSTAPHQEDSAVEVEAQEEPEKQELPKGALKNLVEENAEAKSEEQQEHIDDGINDPKEGEITIKSLCEPIDDRWPMPTKKQRREVRQVINRVCRAHGIGPTDCIYFREIVSIRESSLRWWVRHKLAGDTAAALRAYLAYSRRYGWDTIWHEDARKIEDISKIEYDAIGDEQNLYFLEADRWMFGLGLGAQNVAIHLSRFDNLAPPEILCDQVINVMVQIDIARSAVRKYRAKNWVEVQAIYAGRIGTDENGRGIAGKNAKKDAKIRERCRKKGLNCNAKPKLGGKLKLWKMTVEERYEAAEKIRGNPLPPFDVPRADRVDNESQ